jgi:hypothetical protein
MRRPSAVIRLFWIGFALLQLVEPPVVQLADGHVEAASPASASHIHFEDQANGRCAPVHPSDCALCRFLAQPLLVPAATVLTLAIGTRPWLRGPEAVPVVTRSHTLHPYSRAPPLSV